MKNPKAHDAVNHPKHYNNLGAYCKCGHEIECIDFTRWMVFNVGNAVKYIWRSRDKNGVEDLRKCVWYIVDENLKVSLMTKPEKEVGSLVPRCPRCERILTASMVMHEMPLNLGKAFFSLLAYHYSGDTDYLEVAGIEVLKEVNLLEGKDSELPSPQES